MALVLSTKRTKDYGQQLRDAIVNRDEWRSHTGNMRGTFQHYESGRLPSKYLPAFHRAIYVIYSYATPIAWYGPLGAVEVCWHVPDERYSATTTQHQSVVRAALSRAGKRWAE